MIRLAVAVASEQSPASAFVVWRGFESSIRKARQAGYDGVELALLDANEIAAREIGRMLSDQGLQCPCISTGQVFATLGLHLTCEQHDKARQVVDVLQGLVELAASLGAMVNLGRVRGFVQPGQTVHDATRRFRDNVLALANRAASLGVTLVVEPINRYESNFINTLRDGADLISAVGAGHLRLMPDVFHMNIEERSIAGALEQFGSQVAYIHLADSNRRAPGQGHTDFCAIFAALRRINYEGWASVEILPEPDADTAARQAIEFLRPLKEDYNRG